MKKKNDFLYQLMLLFFLSISIAYLQDFLFNYYFKTSLTLYSNESDEFREMLVPSTAMDGILQFSNEHQLDYLECLTSLMVQHEFNLSSWKQKNVNIIDYNENFNYLAKNYLEEYETLLSSYKAIWKDLRYFPVPKSSKYQIESIFYENSWGFERNYENKKSRHEGTDIMTTNNQRGYFPIVSMTDGVVEQVGWLEKGGYRIGIRSPHGGYFYYAHLYNYAKEFKEGDEIRAGELIGFMGDSGYSKVEGTVGNFDVHLHLGIYIKTKNYNEVSVNPFWILKYLENKSLSFNY